MSAHNPLETIMREEILAVKNAPMQVTTYSYLATIHTPALDIPAMIVKSVNYLRDYNTRFTEVISIQVTVPAGEVIHEILPTYQDLELTLIRIPLETTSSYMEASGIGRHIARYTAKLYNYNNLVVEGENLASQSKHDANINDLIDLDFQLIDPLVEQIRVKQFGGIIRNQSGINAVKAVLSQSTEVSTGVTVEPGYSETIKEHISITHGTRLVDVPKMINKRCGGIYPTGFRYYYYNQMWWIYSPFNVKRFHDAQQTLTVVNLPKDKLAEAETTFRKTGTQMIILATGETKHIDETEIKLQTMGNGVKFIDASQVTKDFGIIEDNKLVVDRSLNVSQVVHSSQERKTNVATMAPSRITSGYNLEYSELARRACSVVQVAWESAEIEYIYAGMPVRFLYMDKDVAKEIYGRVVGVEAKTRPLDRTVKKKRFSMDAIVTFVVANAAVTDESAIDLS